MRQTAAARTLTALVMASLVGACVNIAPNPSLGPTGAPSPSAAATATLARPTASLQPTPTGAPTQTVSPSSTPTPGATPTPTGSSSPAPAATLDPQVASQIDAVTAAVPAIRELDATRDVPYEIISRDQFRNDLIAMNNEDTPPEVQAAEERLLKRLGLLPADADMEQMLVQLYSAEVAAYYRPDTGRFYVIQRDQPFGPVDKIVVAHEYTHALQDMHFDLKGTRIADPSEGDGALAQLAVIEGDAQLSSQMWAFQNIPLDVLAQIALDSFASLDQQELAGMPLILRRQLEFPYTEGFLFVQQIQQLGGWDAVDQAIQTPPASTEDVLHEQKYLDGEAPVAVDEPDISGALGSGWERTYEDTVGELGMQVFVAGGEAPDVSIPGLPVDWPHQEVAAGWGGDRLAMYEGPNSAWLIDWQTAWDTQQDADEFSARMIELVPTFQGHVIVEPGSQPDSIHFLLANDVETMDLVEPPR